MVFCPIDNSQHKSTILRGQVQYTHYQIVVGANEPKAPVLTKPLKSLRQTWPVLKKGILALEEFCLSL